MPKNIDSSKLEYVLSHEAEHIRHFDALMKILLAAVVAIHWFNPLVWIMFIVANKDIELACDEAVVEKSCFSKQTYAMSLLNFKKEKELPLFSYMSCKNLEERIIQIMSYKKYNKLNKLIGLAAVIIVLISTVTISISTINSQNIATVEFTITEESDSAYISAASFYDNSEAVYISSDTQNISVGYSE